MNCGNATCSAPATKKIHVNNVDKFYCDQDMEEYVDILDAMAMPIPVVFNLDGTPVSDDVGYRRLVTPKGHIVRMREIEIEIKPCQTHPDSEIDVIASGVWKGTLFCKKCRTVIKVDESSWKDNPIEPEELK